MTYALQDIGHTHRYEQVKIKEMTTILIVISVVLLGYFILNSLSKKKNIEEEVSRNQNDGIKNSEIPKKRKKGKFDVVGYHYLSEDMKRVVWKELKEGDSLELMPDPNNEHDINAVKVFFKGNQIGWVTKKYYRKEELFNCLIKNIEIKVKCSSNQRKKDYRRASRPDKNGKWNDKYLGMAQFVEASFEINHQT